MAMCSEAGVVSETSTAWRRFLQVIGLISGLLDEFVRDVKRPVVTGGTLVTSEQNRTVSTGCQTNQRVVRRSALNPRRR